MSSLSAAEPGGALPVLEDRLRLHVLGRLELVGPDGTALLGPGKPLAMLTYLRVQAVHTATRPHLMDLLWSDLEPDRARANLRQSLLVLRRVLPADSLVSDGDLIVLRGAIAVDRDDFVAAADRGDLATAIATYRGDFLPDLAVPGGAEFELWCEIERRHLGALFARVLETAAREALAEGRAAEALRHARRLRDVDPSRERSWRLLIEAEIAAEGLATARLEADRLAELLQAEHRPPEPATTRLFERVRDVARQLSTTAGVVASPEFVGRETQLARVLASWGAAKRGHVQHLHVEALAGTGKTRLLEESCARLEAAGARVVRCGARRDEREVPYALAASLVTSLASLRGSVAVAPASMSALVAMAPDASSVFAAPVDTSTGHEAMRRRVLALSDLLRAVAHESAVAVALDDLHWADAASQRLIALALGRLSSDTRLFVLSAGRESFAGESRAERVSLPPLTAAQVDAMLQSLGGAGTGVWWETFVSALRDAANGVAFHVLQLLHAVVEKQLLGIEDELWTAPNVAALLAALDATEAARLRIAQLSVNARTVLRVICLGAAPSVGVISAAVAMDVAAVEADLAKLEIRGYVRRLGDAGWSVAHDEIAELVMAQSDAPSLHEARRGLARALCTLSRPTVSGMRHIAALLLDAGADEEVVRVVHDWVRSGACPRSGVQPSDLLPPVLSPERSEPLQRALRRALPRTGRRLRGPLIVAAAAAGLVAAAWFTTRPVALVMLQAPIATNAAEVTDRPAIIGVEDLLGRRLKTSGINVRVRGAQPNLRWPPSGRVAGVTVAGAALFDSLIVGGSDSKMAELIFESDGLAPVRWLQGGADSPLLRVRSGRVNTKTLSGDVPVIQVAPGERIEGRILLSYRTVWTSATVFLGEVATWESRDSDTLSIRSLVTPLDPGVAEISVRRTAPRQPGRYFILWAMGAEPRAAYLFSQTNWSCGEPLWHNGDDLQDLPSDVLRAAAARGQYAGNGVRCYEARVPTAPRRALTAMGLAAIEVVVGSGR